VSYREAITQTAEIDYVHKKQSGGSGQYARVKIIFEPKEYSEEEGAMDFEFISDLKGGSVPKEYIPGVQKGIESVLGQGVVAGFPVLGMKATLVDGAYHDVDSSVMAFEIAGRAACREGLRKAKARLMEPLMQVDVSTPEEYMGDILGDVNARRGMVGDLGERGNIKTISALVPLANMFQYVSTLRSMSKGRANYSMKLANYDFVPPNVEEELKKGFSAGKDDE
jgi:elongation factor G